MQRAQISAISDTAENDHHNIKNRPVGNFLTGRFGILYCKLAVVQLCVKSVLCEKLFVIALFNDVAVTHYKDNVRLTNGGKAVSYDKACPALHKAYKGFLYLYLGSGVDRGGSLVKDKHGRQAEHYSGNAQQLLLAL